MTDLAYVALGANLGEPRTAFENATLSLIRRNIRVLRRARIYESKPVGPSNQPDYLNSMLELEITGSPWALLETLQTIERELGRKKTMVWGPRVIDLDIILFGNRQLESPELIIPHREMTQRRFVLAPLADLCPDRVVPGTGRNVRALLEALGTDDDGFTTHDSHVETYALAWMNSHRSGA